MTDNPDKPRTHAGGRVHATDSVGSIVETNVARSAASRGNIGVGPGRADRVAHLGANDADRDRAGMTRTIGPTTNHTQKGNNLR